MEKLLTYLNGLSKVQRSEFAMQCGTSEGYLRKAISAHQVLRVPLCVLIERHSQGEVTRKDLHPDDWLANWPELDGRVFNRASRCWVPIETNDS